MRRLIAAGVLLMVPITALLWVETYAKAEPMLLGFPFFIWVVIFNVFIVSQFCAFAKVFYTEGQGRRLLDGVPREPFELSERGARSGVGRGRLQHHRRDAIGMPSRGLIVGTNEVCQSPSD